jgi:integrase
VGGTGNCTASASAEPGNHEALRALGYAYRGSFGRPAQGSADPRKPRRAAELGMKVKIGCHTFRATGITAYLEAGGTLENAQLMAAHESPRTTKLYGPLSTQ